jgi:hypothetical protein
MIAETKERHVFEKIVFGSFLILVASLAVQKPIVLDLAGLRLSATDVLFPVVAVLAVGSVLLRMRAFRWTIAYLPLLFYLAAFFVASYFSEDMGRSIAKSLATAYLVGLAILAINLVDSEKRIRMSIAAWLIGAALPITIGIFTIVLYYVSPSSSLLPYLTYHYGSVPVGPYPRLSSTFVSASMFCNYLNVAILLLLVERTFVWLSDRIWWICFVASVVCVIFTISSGMGAVILGIALWFHYQRRRSRDGKLVLASGIALCTLFLISSFVALSPHSTAPYSVHVPFFDVEVYPSPRLLVWTDALTAFGNNFFVGNGPGTPSASVRFANTEGGYSLLTDAHNSFLSVAAQTGVIGLTAFIALCSYLLKIGFSENKNAVVFALATAFFCAFVVQGLTGSFEDARHLWVLIGMLVAAAMNEKELARDF